MAAHADQLGLFGGDEAAERLGPALPEGFRYQSELISNEEERELLRHIEPLPLKEFEFHGYTGKRRVISFGWRYDFNDRRLEKVDDIPPFLLPLRERAAAFAGLGPSSLQHVLVTQYTAGAAIGWHKDKPVFAEVVGISLGSPCRFRLRRQRPDGTWERAQIVVEPRSAYLLADEARTQWEHSIPAVNRLRYSVTFRNFRDASEPSG
jgi:alkylated DNA repair dioxygenase AlkB